MAKPNRLREIEEQYGDLQKIIPHLVNEHGQAEAARLLDVSPSTISLWLKHNGYVLVTQYVRDHATSEKEPAQ